MLAAIKFDNEFCRQAGEIDDKRADDLLAAKLEAGEAMSADCLPESLLKRRGVHTRSSRARSRLA